jgi:eukaryotic-like serine/threonine-protein kinase
MCNAAYWKQRTIAVTTDIDVNLEPLSGYRLIEHIGSGGYGEVWRAEAPGGLTKAIKFVFGQHNEKRASNELRALDRVREVRHPFLLSLERIEIVDGRLLVVTELADGSVKDRFEAARREGLCGIPRDELLSYLRDAADALDFMSEAHALQHLDIKPENLLLLAGHVKVADFGLVKDMRKSEASIVGGMTPLYAAPEVFRGGPSTRSDQYSLAIVYLEMLTGTLPFVAGNAAELTLQHLNDEPDLSALSMTDRFVVSRAMAKDPHHRYATCREFVDALVKPAKAAAAFDELAPGSAPPGASSARTQPPPRSHLATALFDESHTPWNATPEQLLIAQPPVEAKLVDLPAVDVGKRDVRSMPTLVLGIGGAAGRVLTHLRRMLEEPYNGSPLLPVQFLLLDTDARALSDAARRRSGRLTPSETLHLPVRSPQHYREHSRQLLHWLSRRWLYNIPRSLKTEGLRPLGRLALVEHAREAVHGIRQAIVQAVDANRTTTATASSELALCKGAVRVFVVASISGGTGGGMALDIGFATRAILKQLGLAAAELIGVAMHSTGRDARHSELARVNAFAWLTEHQHFQRPDNAYPGDSYCGLPSHQEGVAAFDSTYLIHLGENLDEVAFDQATQGVSEYLRLNALATISPFFDACREKLRDAAVNPGCRESRTLRSFGVFRRTAAADELCEELAIRVSRQVLAGWRGPQTRIETKSPSERVPTASARASEVGVWLQPDMGESKEQRPSPPGSDQLVRRLQLDSAGLATNARAIVELQLGGDAVSFLSAWAAKQASMRVADEFVQLQAINRMFGVTDDTAKNPKIFLLGQSISAIVQPLEEKLRSEIRRWWSSRIDDPRDRLPGTRQALCWINEHFHEVESDLKRLRQSVEVKLIEVREAVGHGESRAAGGNAEAIHPFSQRILAYFRLRLDQSAIGAAEHMVRLILADATAMADELTALGREIDQIESALARAAAVENVNRQSATDKESPPASDSLWWANVESALPKLAAEVDVRLQADYLHDNGGLLNTIMQGGRPRAMLCAKLQEASHRAAQQFLAGVSVLEHSANAHAQQDRGELRSGLAAATPQLLEFGGTRRVLAVLPGDSAVKADPADLSLALGVDAACVRGADNSLTLCVEAGELSVEHIALNLVQRRRDRVDFAERVHCRTDIAWTPLLAGSATTAVSVWNGPDHRSTQAGQELCKTLVI